MKFLIDTNRYSDFAKNVPDIVELFSNADRIIVPFVVVAELRTGFRSGTLSQKNEASLVKFLSNDRVSIIYPNDGTTHAYAEIYSQLKASGTPVPTNDLWIAALAYQHSLPIATRDAHFDLIPQIAHI